MFFFFGSFQHHVFAQLLACCQVLRIRGNQHLKDLPNAIRSFVRALPCLLWYKHLKKKKNCIQ